MGLTFLDMYQFDKMRYAEAFDNVFHLCTPPIFITVMWYLGIREVSLLSIKLIAFGMY